MTDKDFTLYGTKILNLKTQEIGLLICIWENKFADGIHRISPVLIKKASGTTLN